MVMDKLPEIHLRISVSLTEIKFVPYIINQALQGHGYPQSDHLV